MRISQAIVGFLTVLLGSLPATAQQSEFVLRPAGELTVPGARELIIGGTRAEPSDWPATFVFSDGGGGCTSTAVGERVLLTAAHCVHDGAQGVIYREGSTIPVVCDHHPGYHDGVPNNDPAWEEKVSPDFALCRLGADLTGVEFEWVNADPSVPEHGDLVHLLGFGCNEVGGTDGGFGVLYEGDAAVSALPAGSSYYTTTYGGAALCFGDSGGGAYVFGNPSKTIRWLIGVNSRGDISTMSLLSTTSVGGFVAWAQDWSSTNDVEICGLGANASGCRPQ